MRLWSALAALAVLLVGMAAGCSSDDQESVTPVVIDERSGLLLGIRFGDTGDEVRERLGEPTDSDDGFFPAGSDYTGPPFIRSPGSEGGSPKRPDELHYADAAFLVSSTAGVFAMATLEDGARTKAGIAIGDELDAARRAYDRVRCGEQVAGEPLMGGDAPTYRWCRATAGDVEVFFGGDPIRSITLLRGRE